MATRASETTRMIEGTAAPHRARTSASRIVISLRHCRAVSTCCRVSAAAADCSAIRTFRSVVSLPKSTVSRLTYTLTKLGYLHYVRESGKYRLGTATLALGSAVLGRFDVRDLARPLMQELADAHRHVGRARRAPALEHGRASRSAKAMQCCHSTWKSACVCRLATSAIGRSVSRGVERNRTRRSAGANQRARSRRRGPR